jgi:hypothetical protein
LQQTHDFSPPGQRPHWDSSLDFDHLDRLAASAKEEKVKIQVIPSKFAMRKSNEAM